MGFLAEREVEEALKEGIVESLRKREMDMCSTWDREKALAAPFGMKIELSPSEVDTVRIYAEKAAGRVLTIEEKIRVEIVKADIKERKEKSVLLLRYRYIEGL